MTEKRSTARPMFDTEEQFMQDEPDYQYLSQFLTKEQVEDTIEKLTAEGRCLPLPNWGTMIEYLLKSKSGYYDILRICEAEDGREYFAGLAFCDGVKLDYFDKMVTYKHIAEIARKNSF